MTIFPPSGSKTLNYRKDTKAPSRKPSQSSPLLKIPQNKKLNSLIRNAKVGTRRIIEQRMIITMTKIKKETVNIRFHAGYRNTTTIGMIVQTILKVETSMAAGLQIKGIRNQITLNVMTTKTLMEKFNTCNSVPTLNKSILKESCTLWKRNHLKKKTTSPSQL